MTEDLSNGYDAAAHSFIAMRSTLGRDVIAQWAGAFPQGGSVLDLGCGYGQPVTEALIDAGLTVSAIDASPTMVAACRQRFPQLEVACEAVEHSEFFGKTFHGMTAIGLVFLLGEVEQRALFFRVAAALKPSGAFLFSAPRQACEWADTLTGLPSRSLGAEAYEQLIVDAGLCLKGKCQDQGKNHYFAAVKVAPFAD